MPADRFDGSRAVSARLVKRDSTDWKSVRERLRKISLVGFREREMSADRLDWTRAVTIGLAKRDPTYRKAVHERLKYMWQVGFREGRNVGRPTRSDTGRQDRNV